MSDFVAGLDAAGEGAVGEVEHAAKVSRAAAAARRMIFIVPLRSVEMEKVSGNAPASL
jgi:hypothetical protein